MSHFLHSKDYSICTALSWGIFAGHCREASNLSTSWLDRALHVGIAILELFPIIGQIAALFELAIAYQCGVIAPDLSQREIQQLEPKIEERQQSKEGQSEQRRESQERAKAKVKKASAERMPVLEKSVPVPLILERKVLEESSSEGTTEETDSNDEVVFLDDTPQSDDPLTEEMLSKMPDRGISSWLKAFIEEHAITNQKILVALLKEFAHREPYELSRTLKNYTDIDEESRLEILEVIGIKQFFTLVKMEEYQSLPESARIELVLKITPMAHYGVSQYIHESGINDANALVEIAKRLAVYVYDVTYMDSFLGHCQASFSSADIDQTELYLELLTILAQNRHNIIPAIRKEKVLSEEDRVRLVKLMEEVSYNNILDKFPEFDIQDPEALLEIGKILMSKVYPIEKMRQYIEYCQQVLGSSEEVSFELALFAVESQREISSVIQIFGIESEERRIRLAKLGAEKHSGPIINHIANYDIKKPEALLEIGKILVSKNYCVKNVLGYIEYCKSVESPSIDLCFELALLMIEKGMDISHEFQVLGIQNEANRIKLAKLEAARHPSSLIQKIANYDIKDPEELLEIWETLLPRIYSLEQMIAYITYCKNVGLSRDLGQELAMIATRAKKDISPIFEVFGIESEAERIYLAMSVIKYAPYSVAKHIKQYRIKDPDQLIEIGKTLVTKSVYNLDEIYAYFEYCSTLDVGAAHVCSKLIQLICTYNYNGRHLIIEKIVPFIRALEIEDQEKLINIAKLLAGYAPISLFAAIDIHQIRDEKSRKEVLEAALVANREFSAPFVIPLLQSGFISDPANIISLVRRFLENDFIDVEQYFAKYQFLEKYIAPLDENSMEMIAELVSTVVRKAPHSIIILMNHYGIRDEAGRVQIARRIMAKRGEVDIQHFSIENPLSRIELLKEFARQTSPVVQWTNLINIMHSWEIPEEIRARIVLERMKIGSVEYQLKHLRITNPHIYKKIVKADLLSWQHYFHNFSRIQEYQLSPEDASRLEKAWLQNYYAKNNVTSLQILQSIKMHGFKQSFIQYALLRVIQEYEYELENIPEATLESGRQAGVPFEAERNPREVVIEVMTSSFQQETTKRAFVDALAYRNKSVAVSLTGILWQEGCFSDYETQYSSLLEKSAPSPLLWIAPAKWVVEAKREGGDVDDRQIEELSALFQARKTKWRDDTSELQKQYLLTVSALDKTILLSSERKFALLLKILALDEKDAVTSLRLLASLAERNAEEELDSLDIDYPIESLCSALCVVIKRGTFIEFDEIEGGVQRYLHVFGKMRVPYGIETYGLKIQSLPEMRSHFNRFVVSVLQGRFLEERNRIDNNPHLTHIYTHDDKILANWASLEIAVPVSSGENAEKLFSAELGAELEQYPELREFLSATDPLQREEIKQILLAKGKEGRFPLACIGWMEDPANKKCSDKMSSFTPKELKGAVKVMLKNFHSSRVEMSAILTCHWEDLILAGEEMPNSCQKLNASPELTKCLLGYALDGKTQMIAIKNQHNKLIARQFIRLLWDENTQRPVLFLEDLYTAVPVTESMKKAMIEAAKECARKLGCPLYHRGSDSVKISSFGSSCPAEYVDALGSFQIGSSTNGKYTIKSAKEIVVEYVDHDEAEAISASAAIPSSLVTFSAP